MGNYIAITRELFKKEIPIFYQWWQPDESIVTPNRLFFKSEYFECLLNSTNENVEGFGSRDCFGGVTSLIKLGNPKLMNEDVYQDAAKMIMKFNPNISTINHLLEVTREKDDFDATCSWLKANQKQVALWLQDVNKFAPPVEDEGMNVELLLWLGMGTIVLFLIVIYLLQRSGVFEIISEAFLGPMIVSVVMYVWKLADYSFTWILYFELNDNPTVHDQFITCYIIFIASHSLAFGASMYYNSLNVLQVCYDDGSGQNLIGQPMAMRNEKNIKYTLAKIEMAIQLDTADCLGLFLEDLPGVCILMYCLHQFDNDMTITFLLGLMTQFVEFGFTLSGPTSLKHHVDIRETLLVENTLQNTEAKE
jgi:hypothetical protein